MGRKYNGVSGGGMILKNDSNGLILYTLLFVATVTGVYVAFNDWCDYKSLSQ